LLAYGCPVEEFLKAWKFGDWNRFKIRCEGEFPYSTTWINGTTIAETDSARIVWPGFDKQATGAPLGRRGRVSLEVHGNGRGDVLGTDRWAHGAVCRWRNIAVKTL